ncbi:MAG: hypothetical protein QOK37_1570 [Thermoanaerobaculia bacterium]|jgi:hypothetical protein|nr:hypothetical protein [Thermoanaerobaculia bacterium]
MFAGTPSLPQFTGKLFVRESDERLDYDTPQLIRDALHDLAFDVVVEPLLFFVIAPASS